MSYLVLARKWRPRRFAELVGQEHVVRALTNALESGKVHHAFLFSGTRGVGKTTIARIFAKSLNCERGAGAEPCGECSSCVDIDAGRFVDLLEIDAASHTGVDNVRELIDNAQYLPSRGRIKVYLIDEVHMLTKQAFNALLKTLEEPPEHVKFLLATTDPDKLPVTVLSRCLQFNLKRLDETQIIGQMRRILEAEGIAAEDGALAQLAHAADGSLRDGLSLLDQAIAFTGSRLEAGLVADMLGTVDRGQVDGLLQALASADGGRLMAAVGRLAEFSPDYAAVLDALAEALHGIQLCQLVPDLAAAPGVDGDDPARDAIAAAVGPELVQLWYQMAVGGRRDLDAAPSARVGFEMTLLRMLAFGPDSENAGADAGPPAGREVRSRSPSAASGEGTRNDAGAAPGRDRPSDASVLGPRAAVPVEATPLPASDPAAAEPGRSPPVEPAPPVAQTHALASSADWIALVTRLSLRGPLGMLAANAGFQSYRDGRLRLTLPASDGHLCGERLVARLAQALAPALGARPMIECDTSGDGGAETLVAHRERDGQQRLDEATRGFLADPAVSRLMREHGATLVPDSIRPHEDS